MRIVSVNFAVLRLIRYWGNGGTFIPSSSDDGLCPGEILLRHIERDPLASEYP